MIRDVDRAFLQRADTAPAPAPVASPVRVAVPAFVAQ